MFKKLILIEDKNEYQCDSIEELVKTLIDENYYNFTEEEKNNKLKMLSLANSLGNNGNFNIKNEITYILSLLITNKVILLESTNSNFFTKYIDKSKISDNYIIVNTFAKEILQKIWIRIYLIYYFILKKKRLIDIVYL